MAYAVIRSGGKQYQVKPGDTIEVELVEAEKTVTFDDVLLYVDESKIEIGTPTVKGVTVTGEVVNPSKKGVKIRVFKYKSKSRYRKLRGHRQTHTVVKIMTVGSAKLEAPTKKTSKVAGKTETKVAAKPVQKVAAKKPATKKAPVKKAAAKK